MRQILQTPPLLSYILIIYFLYYMFINNIKEYIMNTRQLTSETQEYVGNVSFSLYFPVSSGFYALP